MLEIINSTNHQRHGKFIGIKFIETKFIGGKLMDRKLIDGKFINKFGQLCILNC